MNQAELTEWLRDMAEGPMAHNPEHADTCNKLTAVRMEIERLQAIVDRLPKTADGVPIVPGMDVFRCGGKLRSRAMMHYEPWSNHCWEDCVCGPSARSSYSTREAAGAPSQRELLK